MTQINNKLIVVTREDLPNQYPAVQAGHSAIKFQYDYPDIAKEWYKNSNYLIYLKIKNYNEFIKFIKKLIDNDIRHSLFYEPDINEYTSVTLEPSEKSRKITKKLKLL